MESPGANYPYLQGVLEVLYDVRKYSFTFHDIPHIPQFPVYFRQHNEFISDNRKHEIIDCETYDQDPMTNDNSCLSIWGTGLGVSYTGEWGTVTNRSQFGSFRGEINSNGEYPVIIRKSVQDFPEHGNVNSNYV